MMSTPSKHKRALDRSIAAGRADYKAGRFIGPFSSVQEEQVASATGDLRHLYKQMLRPKWTSKQVAEAARGLLGPAIAQLERALNNMVVEVAGQPGELHRISKKDYVAMLTARAKGPAHPITDSPGAVSSPPRKRKKLL